MELPLVSLILSTLLPKQRLLLGPSIRYINDWVCPENTSMRALLSTLFVGVYAVVAQGSTPVSI